MARVPEPGRAGNSGGGNIADHSSLLSFEDSANAVFPLWHPADDVAIELGSANSMMKRNVGEYLRSVRTARRKQEMLLRAVVHNLMLGPKLGEGRD